MWYYRTNSQQSIRIRNLETEGSRLLAENLSLREQVLQLQNALESRSSRPSFEDIDVVKSKLEAKMMEFGSLIAELGQMRKRNSRTGRKSQAATARRNPEDRQWRSGLGLQAVEEAMLPTITEDKYYPRRTMGYVWSRLDIRPYYQGRS
jgi:23S rRNA maturation mini-RNase III